MLWLGLAATGGISSAWAFPFPIIWIPGGIICVLLSFIRPLRVAAILLATFFIFGVYWIAQIHSHPQNDLRNLLQAESKEIILTGTLSDEPRIRHYDSGYTQMDLLLDVDGILSPQGIISADGKLLIRVHDPIPDDLHYGDTVNISALVGKPSLPMNPGQFNMPDYLALQGIYFTGSATGNDIQKIGENHGSYWMKAALVMREHMTDTLHIPPTPIFVDLTRKCLPTFFTSQTDEQISILMTGMLFGYYDDLNPVVVNAFRTTGTMHVFAVSGQNVAALTAALILVLEMLGLIKWRWAWVLVPMVFIFCLSTGMQASAARACIMVSLAYVGWSLYRKVDALNVLGASALLLYLWDPSDLFNAGFQLSFAIVFGLLTITPVLGPWLLKPFEPDPFIPRRFIPVWREKFYQLARWICLLLGISLAAWISSLPLILWYFRQCSPVAMIANLIVCPSADLVLILCTFSVGASCFSSTLAALINFITWCCCQFIVAIVLFFSYLPGGYFTVSLAPEAWHREPSITVLSTPASSPLIVRCGGECWLIGSGSDRAEQQVVFPALRYYGVNRLSGLVFPEGIFSQIGGGTALLATMHPEWVADTGWKTRSRQAQRFVADLGKIEQPRRFLREGDEEDWGNHFHVHVLWPDEEKRNFPAADEGMVIMIQSGKFKILYAGSISEKVEEILLERSPDLAADILIQATTTNHENLSKNWLEAVHPQLLLRPVPSYNSRDDLPRDTLPDETSPEMIRLDQSGAVQLTLMNDMLEVKSFGPSTIHSSLQSITSAAEKNETIPTQHPEK